METNTRLAIGMMSGSSMDGIDLALCRFQLDIQEEGFSVPEWEILKAETIPFSEDWKERLPILTEASALEYLEAHTAFGKYCGAAINEFLQTNNATLSAQHSAIIGFHGHTIFHHPEKGFTAQLGDGTAVAASTGMATVANLRSMDVALGGQGAPVAPIADKYLYPGYDFYLNLGGIANLTAHSREGFLAFDVCAANQLLNLFAQQLGKSYDPGGFIASTGRVNEDFLDLLREDPYLELPYPKSLANTNPSRKKELLKFSAVPTKDLLRTTVEFITTEIHASLKKLIESESFERNAFRLLVTGGGAYNTYLLRRLQEKLEPLHIEIVLPSPLQIDFKEAALMAFMALLRMEGLPNIMSSVTGAKRDSVAGAIHLGNGD